MTDLKAHIKRDFVDLSQVPGYFEALKIANKSSDFKLSSLAFSSICHLVKRVGMQDPNSLRNSSKTVLPILINRLLDSKNNLRIQAKSTLETFWLATPSIVEIYIRDTALIHSNPRIRSESIIFLSDLIELNKNFDFLSFLPNLVNLLRDDSTEVNKNVEVLILKYFTFNKLKLNELIKEFKNQKLESKKAVKILRELDLSSANAYAAENKQQPKPTIDTFANLAKPKRAISSSSNARSVSNSSVVPSHDLSDILSKIPSAKLDESIKPVSVRSSDELQKEVEKLLSPFQGKETEFNWSAREKSIIRFRGLVIANSEEFPDELVQATRQLVDGINKSTLSLRTTLSSNGCQLIKELAVYLTKSIDPLAEQLFQPLASLTSATKKITSLNSFGSISVLLTNTSFNNRLFNQCFNLYQDKNIQPRLYSSTFLQIYLLKHGSKLDQINLETINKWLGKGVADPNTTVRESMRVTFWIFNRKFKELSEILYSKLDSNVQKNLERSRPRDLNSKASILSKSNSIPEKKRESFREFVASKQRDRRSTSGPTAASKDSHTDIIMEPASITSSDFGRPNRIGVPQRVRSGSDLPPLQRQLSKGSSTSQTRNSPQPTIIHSASDSRENTETIESNPEIDALIRLLKSPLTRERLEAIQVIERILISDEIELPNLTYSLLNLVVLDTFLLKPLLKYPKFFKLLDVSLSLRILSVIKQDLSVLLEVATPREIIDGLISLISNLENLRFDNAPSTMFHIKYKTQFLDSSVQNIYSILLANENKELNDDPELIKKVCNHVFPLCISDYPKYDELILHLNSVQPEMFQDVLNNKSPYIKSKINSILDEFKDQDINENHNNENSFTTDHALKNMTMINPLNKKANDPTTSIKPGFSTDLTKIIPSFTKPIISEPEIKEHEMDLDVEHDKNIDYMGDIFNVSKEKAEDENIEVEEDSPKPDIDMEIEVSRAASGSPISNTASPFLDHLLEDDKIIDKHDDITEKLTNKIGEIYISPEKARFQTPDRKSLNNIIDQSDPFFNKTRKHIKIFEDMPSTAQINNQQKERLIDFELSKFDIIKADEEISVASIKESLSLLRKDKADNKELNSLIKSLHEIINNEEILGWVKESGFKEILSDLIYYFNNSINITKKLCFKGLIIFKELLIISEYLDNLIEMKEVQSIWSILNMIIENLKDFRNEIFLTIDELVDDLLELNMSEIKFEIIKNCCSSLKEQNDHLLLISFNLLTLSKCIDSEDLSFDKIKEIDSIIFKFLSNEEVEIRRLTIIIYSKCKRKLKEFDQNLNNIYDDKTKIAQDTYNDVFEKLSLPQKRLIDYYCEN